MTTEKKFKRTMEVLSTVAAFITAIIGVMEVILPLLSSKEKEEENDGG